HSIEYPCPNCGRESLLDLHIAARPIAMLSNGGLIFDRGDKPNNCLPDQVQCRHCYVILSDREDRPVTSREKQIVEEYREDPDERLREAV
ncbi:MAG: phage terminase large subunit family protein, partial [Nitrososphaera sp.]|nr:phage terminase large subunit family protein [Nitrososphaera sp.]